MGVRRRLEALTDNSSKFQDHRKHLSPSTITPTLTLTLLKHPYPNLNPTLIQKLKLSETVKLDSYLDFRGLNKFSTSCRVPNKCMTLEYSIPLSTLSTHTRLNVRELTAIGNRWNLAKRPPNVVQNDGYRENDGYRVPAGYRVQHIQAKIDNNQYLLLHRRHLDRDQIESFFFLLLMQSLEAMVLK